MYDKLDKIHKSGAKVVLSKLPIGDVATQYFADRDLFCAGRVAEEDLKRTMMVRLGCASVPRGSALASLHVLLKQWPVSALSEGFWQRGDPSLEGGAVGSVAFNS